MTIIGAAPAARTPEDLQAEAEKLAEEFGAILPFLPAQNLLQVPSELAPGMAKFVPVPTFIDAFEVASVAPVFADEHGKTFAPNTCQITTKLGQQLQAPYNVSVMVRLVKLARSRVLGRR